MQKTRGLYDDLIDSTKMTSIVDTVLKCDLHTSCAVVDFSVVWWHTGINWFHILSYVVTQCDISRSSSKRNYLETGSYALEA